MPKYYTQNGDLTRWALRLGYQQQFKHGEIYTSMYQEFDTIHVRSYDHSKGERIAWDRFTHIKPARKRFKELCRGAMQRM